MKKFLLSLVLLVGLVFTSCDNSDRFENMVETKSTTDLIMLKSNDDVPVTYNIEVMKFDYENHKYLMFKTGSGKYGKMGVVHDPNCPNHNTGLENETTEIENDNYYTY